MYLKYHTKGIVISGKSESGDSRRINIFTENFGLINARVQGSRNVHSKLRNGTQDFSLGEFSLVSGKTGWRVVSARAEKNLFENFRNNPSKIKIMANILNLIKKLVGEEKQSAVFSAVINLFIFLDSCSGKNVALAECLTIMRILHALGYMVSDPEISIPISSYEIAVEDLDTIAPRRKEIISLINESLKAA